MESGWIPQQAVFDIEKYNKITTTKTILRKWIEQGAIEAKTIIKGRRTLFLKESDLDALVELADNYYPEKIAVKHLGYSPRTINYVRSNQDAFDSFVNFFKSQGIKVVYFPNGITWNSTKSVQLFIHKEDLHRFLDSHLLFGDAIKQSNYPSRIYKQVKQKNIRLIKVFPDAKQFPYISKQDFEKHLNYEIKYTPDELYSLKEANKLLGGVSRPSIEKIVKEEKIEKIYIGKLLFFRKKDIHNLVTQMAAIKKKYCTFKDVLRLCNLKGALDNGVLDSVKTSTLESLALGGGKNVMYSLDSVLEYKKTQETREQITQVLDELDTSENPTKQFEKILKIREITFSAHAPYTEQEWLSFVHFKLNTMSRRQLRATIPGYVDATEYLSNLTKEKELYSLSSNDINLKLFNHHVGKKKQGFLYAFISEYHQKIEFNLMVSKVEKKTFDMKKITNPNKYESKVKDKETYDFKTEYRPLYDYASRMEHKDKAILDAENIINGNHSDVNYYSSMWLYILIHLGNAWRHGDVVSLPVIDLKNAPSLETLKVRDLTLEEATTIVNQIKRKDLKANKNNATNHFNCPEDLVVQYATAAIICSIIQSKTIGKIGYKDNEEEFPMIDFRMRNRDRYSQKSHSAFFKDFKIKNFEFKSLKMNRTVLVLMYLVLMKGGKGSAALELAQKLRAHKDFESTNIYLVLPEDELESLSLSLFNRKPFGYVVDLMATVLLGDTEDREKRTQEIIAINSTFGGIHKLEATSGFINKTLAERKKVAEMIFEMGIDDATKLMFDLKVDALPSREENIQCIVSPDCQKPELESCMDCPFSIPNFYAISSLAESVKSSILEFLREYEPNGYEGEKTRIMNRLYRDMDNFERACLKFGEQEVFAFFEDGKDEYNQLLDMFDKAAEQTGEDINKYKTYNPIYLQ